MERSANHELVVVQSERVDPRTRSTWQPAEQHDRPARTHELHCVRPRLRQCRLPPARRPPRARRPARHQSRSRAHAAPRGRRRRPASPPRRRHTPRASIRSAPRRESRRSHRGRPPHARRRAGNTQAARAARRPRARAWAERRGGSPPRSARAPRSSRHRHRRGTAARGTAPLARSRRRRRTARSWPPPSCARRRDRRTRARRARATRAAGSGGRGDTSSDPCRRSTRARSARAPRRAPAPDEAHPRCAGRPARRASPPSRRERDLQRGAAAVEVDSLAEPLQRQERHLGQDERRQELDGGVKVRRRRRA